jgi:YVTN family beta-propeller protein
MAMRGIVVHRPRWRDRLVSGYRLSPRTAKWQVTGIPVPGKVPEGIDLSPDGKEIWTATRGDGGVSIIDVASKKVTQTFNLGMKDANRLKFTPDGKLVLISDEAGNSLVVLDAAARKEIKRLNMAPNAVLVHPDGSRAYAALRKDNSVAVIDLKTLEVTNRIPTGPVSGPGCMFWVETR